MSFFFCFFFDVLSTVHRSKFHPPCRVSSLSPLNGVNKVGNPPGKDNPFENIAFGRRPLLSRQSHGMLGCRCALPSTPSTDKSKCTNIKVRLGGSTTLPPHPKSGLPYQRRFNTCYAQFYCKNVVKYIFYRRT